MYAEQYVNIKKAEKAYREGRQKETMTSYLISSKCKQGRDFDSICLKCGACGRKFKDGILV